ncbi:transporter substrate-binding domain-containing protein [Pseudomonas gingeri]|uniref:transporter substrate-binding domain-containing protein n=1 Tax=Pseudomonas gingeri TaxID=117681 RepID=UPI00159FCA3A|nr:transporter substrate-binding domain-containing protein [Pseudomonas gingeri]NWD66786.1 transporter substrate-binding domain-containing protein [Pseudomonas gingeri]
MDFFAKWLPVFCRAGVCGIALLSASTLCVATETPKAEIRFGVEALVPPFESRNAQGELVGLNIELGNALCAELKRRCVWVDQDYAGMIPALEAGKFDAIMPMTPTPERRGTIDFTDPLYALSSRLVARKGSGLLPDAASLKGKQVGVLKGTNREAYAKAQWGQQGVAIRSYALNDELVRGLLAGEIDATLQDTLEIAEIFLKVPQGQDFEFAGPVVIDERLGSAIAMGVRQPDRELREALNRALQSLKDSGQYAAIVSRYLPGVSVARVRPELQFLGEQPGLPFSEVVRAGQWLYLSGVLGSDDADKLVRGGIRAEMGQALKRIRGTLERNGSSMENVARCTVILADIKDFAAMNEVYLQHFKAGSRPARTTFQAGKLLMDARVEVECQAMVKA